MANSLDPQLFAPSQLGGHIDSYELGEFARNGLPFECQDCQSELTAYYNWDEKKYFCENCGLEMNSKGISSDESEIVRSNTILQGKKEG